MPDPFNLRSLDDDELQITAPPASQIRSRGDRRRNTRRVGVAVVAVAAVGALAITVNNLYPASQPGIDIATTPSPTPTQSPTGSPSPDPSPSPDGGTTPLPPPTTGDPVPGVPAPDWGNVPLPEDLAAFFPGIEISIGSEYEQWQVEPHTICAIDVEALGATTVLIREFSDEFGDSHTKTATLGFGSPEEATAAVEAINESYLHCVPSGPDGGTVMIWQDPVDVDPAPSVVEAAEDRDPVRVTSAVSVIVPVGSDIGMISTSNITQAGDRLTWLVSEFEGMDYNCLPEADPETGMEQCTAVAAMEPVGLRLVG